MAPRTRFHPADTSFRRTVHLSDAKRAELLHRLDELAKRAGLFEQMDADSSEHKTVNFRVTVHHPGGGSARFLIFSRHFGSEGMWFLHSGYLNPGTQCVFILPRGDDQEGGVLGMVESCEHLDRNIHAVGVRFESEIDADQFAPAQKSEPGGHSPAASLELPHLDARVLILDDQAMDRELLAFHLRSTGLKLSARQRLEDALDAIAHEKFDLLVCELNLAEGPGEQAIELLRKRGFGAPIVVLTSETAPARHAAARKAGAAAVIAKPYNAEALIKVIAHLLSAHSAERARAAAMHVDREPIVSSLSENPDMAPLLEAYITQVSGTLTELAQAIREDDLATVRRLCLAFKGSGAGYGFAPLSTAADTAVRQLDASNSLQKTLPKLNALHDIGRRLSAGEEQKG